MSLTAAALNPMQAYEELMRFAGKFGEAPLRLALHAAVPQSFRIDLLHLIKLNFVPEAKDETTVEADLLLSPLCIDIGRGYFQFDPQVRLMLLDNLAEIYAPETTPRIHRVANFLLSYANSFSRQPSDGNDRLWKEYLETQRWVALAFINPESAAQQFAEYLKQAVAGKDVVTRLQLGTLAASLAAPLAAYSNLLNYASALQTLETKGWDEANKKFGDFLEKEITVGAITLRPASAIIWEPYKPPPPEEESDEASTAPDSDYSEDFNDVYISFAYEYSEQDWEAAFHEILTQGLERKLGYLPRIWRAESLAATSSGAILDNIRKAKVFVVILSPSYLNSGFAQTEVQLFLKQTNDGLINGRSRIFTVVKTPVGFESLPNILRRSIGYDFTDFDRTRFKSKEKSEEFIRKVDILASDIAETLWTLNREAEKPEKETVSLNNHFNVPFASKGEAFVGREGLREKIWESLNRSGRAAIGQAVSINGIGGLGKTQLAVEYAHTYRHRYENGVFWLTADEDLDSQLIKIGEELNWINQFNTGFDQAELVRNRFRKLYDCLIIFDNVQDLSDIKNYLPERHARPHILITSREKQSGFYQINLDLLARDEARTLLLSVAERTPAKDSEKQALEKILDELEDLPLAVELVGGYLSEHPTVTFEGYYKFLQEVPLDKLEAEFPESSFTRHDKSVIRSLKISEKFLNEKPLAREILDILSWSGKATMGYSLLQALVGTAADNFALQTALSDTVNAGLIKHEADVRRYSIHPLIARVRRRENPLQDRKDWAEMIVRRLSEWFNSRLYEFDNSSEPEAEIEHLLEWQKLINNINPAEAVNLILLISGLNRQQNNYQEAETLMLNALSIYKSREISDESLLILIYNELSLINFKLAKYKKALDYQHQATAIQRVKGHENMPVYDVVRQALELGDYSTFYSLIKENRGRRNYEEVHSYLESAIFDSQLNKVGVLNEIAITYKAEEKLDKAIQTFLEAIEIDPTALRSYNELGITYRENNQLELAIETFRKALEIKSNDVRILNELGTTYRQNNQIPLAVETLEKAVELGDYRSSIELAMCYRQFKQLDKAIQILEKAREINPNDIKVLNELGISYRQNRQIDKAIEILETANEINPDNVRVLNELAICYQENKDYKKSIEAAEQAIKLKNYSSYTVLAITYQKMGDIEMAYQVAEEGMKTSDWNKSRFTKKFHELKELLNQQNQSNKDLKKLNVLLLYSHKDEEIKQELDIQLAALKRTDKISTWSDRKISPGTEWDNQIKQELDNADIILLLISADFIASEYIWNIEIKKAIEKHKKGETLVIPIFCRACDFRDMPFANLQGLPKDGKFINSQPNKDEALAEVAQELRKIVQTQLS